MQHKKDYPDYKYQPRRRKSTKPGQGEFTQGLSQQQPQQSAFKAEYGVTRLDGNGAVHQHFSPNRTGDKIIFTFYAVRHRLLIEAPFSLI